MYNFSTALDTAPVFDRLEIEDRSWQITWRGELRWDRTGESGFCRPIVIEAHDHYLPGYLFEQSHVLFPECITASLADAIELAKESMRVCTGAFA